MMMIMIMGGCGGQSNLGNAMILKVLIVYAPSLTLLIIIQEINIDHDDHLENSIISLFHPVSEFSSPPALLCQQGLPESIIHSCLKVILIRIMSICELLMIPHLIKVMVREVSHTNS